MASSRIEDFFKDIEVVPRTRMLRVDKCEIESDLVVLCGMYDEEIPVNISIPCDIVKDIVSKAVINNCRFNEDEE